MNNDNKAIQAGPAAAADEPNTNNPFFADALDRKNRLRAILDGLPKADPGALPITPAERRLATLTTVENLEQAALFAEETPNVGGELSDVQKLREIINYLLAYEGVKEQALFLFGDLDQTIIRQKLEGAKYARGLYRMAKAYVASAPVKRLQSKVQAMKQTFGFGRRNRKPAPPADAEAPAVKK